MPVTYGSDELGTYEQEQQNQQGQQVTPDGGAYVQAADGTLTWQAGATPDPALVAKWGYAAMTDIRQDPTGKLNYGAWTAVKGGGWAWTWGATPEQSLVNTYGLGKITNPYATPFGQDTRAQNTPALPDVNSPTVVDQWNGVGPDVTGAVAGPTDGSTPTTVSEPPAHRAYVVSPGGIRDAENTVLHSTDTAIDAYNTLKSAVEASKNENVYTASSREQLISMQDRALLNIADVITLAGQYASMLNNAAQTYARADLDSVLPQD